MKPRRASLQLRTALLLTGMLSLSACATAAVSSAAQPATNVCRLIPVPAYDHEFNRKLADEIQAAPIESVFPEAIRGCIATRDAVRACAAGQ